MDGATGAGLIWGEPAPRIEGDVDGLPMAAHDGPMDEHGGRTIEGTPWEEARGPHLPDPLTRGAARIPRTSWVWIAMAAFVGVWHVLRWGYDPSQPGAFLIILLGIVPVVAPFLFGAALFGRHRDAWSRHRTVAIAVALLSLSGVVAMIPALAWSVTLSVDPEADFTTTIWQLGGLTSGTVALVGVVALARGLSGARLHQGVRRPTIGIGLIWAVAIVLAVGSVYVSIGFFWPSPLGDADLWTQAVAVVSSLVGVATVLAWAYLATVTLSGRAARERPIGAWRFAAIGPLAILASYAVLTGTYSIILLVLGTTNDGNLLSSISLGATGATAMGYLALIAAFVSGLPSDDEGADNLGGRATA